MNNNKNNDNNNNNNNNNNSNNSEGQLSMLKIFSENTGTQLGLEKYTKVTFKKGLLLKSKNISLDINTKKYKVRAH